MLLCLGMNRDLAKTVPSADCTDGTNLARRGMVARVGMDRDLAKTVPTFFEGWRGGAERGARDGTEIARAKTVPTFLRVKKSL